MKILDKINIQDKEYICIQELYVNSKKICIVYNKESNEKKFLDDITKEEIKDKEILRKIDMYTKPKTDISIGDRPKSDKLSGSGKNLER